jgi:hypothetical protein
MADVNWMFDWEEAAEHPKRAAAAAGAVGFVLGALVGYLRFDHRLSYGAAIGMCVAVILGAGTWRTVTDPERVAHLKARRAGSLPTAVARLAIPFLSLAVAAVAGIVTGSLTVFIVVLAVCVPVGLFLGRMLPP